MTEAKDWLIKKRGYFYRADKCGYTARLEDAGLYTEAEAKAEARIEPAVMSAHHVSEFPELTAIVSAAPSPAIDEVEAVARAICEAMMETGHTDWGGPVPAPDYYAGARAAISAIRQRAAMDDLLRMDGELYDVPESSRRVRKILADALEEVGDPSEMTKYGRADAALIELEHNGLSIRPTALSEEERARVSVALLDAQSLLLDRFADWESDSSPVFREPGMELVYGAVRDAVVLLDKPTNQETRND